MRLLPLMIALLSVLVAPSASADIFPGTHLRGAPAITSWKAQRDFRIIKQELDYSCGAASLATILTSYYGLNVSELEVLEKMGITDRASFQQLADVAPAFGMKAGGFMLSFDDLKHLKVPAIAFVQYRGQDHFTVIRGIRDDGVVQLADPSWGNRQLTARQFRTIWETSDVAQAKQGRILLVMPSDTDFHTIDTTFFAPPTGWRLALQAIPLAK